MSIPLMSRLRTITGSTRRLRIAGCRAEYIITSRKWALRTASPVISTAPGASVRSARASSITVRTANRIVRLSCRVARRRTNPGALTCRASSARYVTAHAAVKPHSEGSSARTGSAAKPAPKRITRRRSVFPGTRRAVHNRRIVMGGAFSSYGNDLVVGSSTRAGGEWLYILASERIHFRLTGGCCSAFPGSSRKGEPNRPRDASGTGSGDWTDARPRVPFAYIADEVPEVARGDRTQGGRGKAGCGRGPQDRRQGGFLVADHRRRRPRRRPGRRARRRPRQEPQRRRARDRPGLLGSHRRRTRPAGAAPPPPRPRPPAGRRQRRPGPARRPLHRLLRAVRRARRPGAADQR